MVICRTHLERRKKTKDKQNCESNKLKIVRAHTHTHAHIGIGIGTLRINLMFESKYRIPSQHLLSNK